MAKGGSNFHILKGHPKAMKVLPQEYDKDAYCKDAPFHYISTLVDM